MFFLLQAEPTTALFSRLGDQLFSIIMLVVIAMILWKRQKALEDRLANYMADDHERMIEVLEKNTKVMEGLEQILEKRNNS